MEAPTMPNPDPNRPKSEATHTAEEWRVHPYNAGSRHNAGRDIGPHGFAVATVIGDFEANGRGVRPADMGDTGTANAHRIVACVNALDGWADPSAAGDLLEAAKRAVDIIQGGDKFDSLESWAQDLVGGLRAAIAKAGRK